MKRLNIVLGLGAAALLCAGPAAHAARVGVFVGGGVPLYYPAAPVVPYYYPPPYPVYVPQPVAPPPPEYIERGQAGGDEADDEDDEAGPDNGGNGGSGYWYYCDASRAYYPSVKQCSSGWRPVAPQQPQPSQAPGQPAPGQ